MIHSKKNNKSICISFILMVMSTFSLAHADDLSLPTNGDILSPVQDGDYINNGTQYKALLENYIQDDKFKVRSFEEKEKVLDKLVNDEIEDIGLRILRESEIKPWTKDASKLGEEIEKKIQSLRVLADVLRDSGYPEFEALVSSGVGEARDLYLFQEDGRSLCKNHNEASCPGHKRMFLTELIEKIANEEIKNRLIEIVQNFSSYQAVPERPLLCLNPKEAEVKPSFENKDSSFLCGIARSHKIRKAIKKGISYFSGQEPEYSCLSVNLNLIKVKDNNGRLVIQLGADKASYVIDSTGKRINIGATELKWLQQEMEYF